MMRVMLLTRLKIATVLLLSAGVLGLGIAARAYQAPPPAGAPKIPAASSPQGAKADKEPSAEELPTTAMPSQAFIRVIGKGKDLEVRQKLTTYRAITRKQGAKEVTYYDRVYSDQSRQFELALVKVYDSHGKKLDVKTMRKLLKGEKLALVYPDGQELDPLHLRVLKEGTLLVVLPAAANAGSAPAFEVPPGALPPPAMTLPQGVLPANLPPGAIPPPPPVAPAEVPPPPKKQ
jgi:hypothetical protein